MFWRSKYLRPQGLWTPRVDVKVHSSHGVTLQGLGRQLRMSRAAEAAPVVGVTPNGGRGVGRVETPTV